MGGMIVKRLVGDEHLFKCSEIYKIKTRISGTTPLSYAIFKSSFAKYFENNDNAYAFGCFENDELISWIALRFIENKSRGKFWSILALHTTKFTTYFSFNNEEIGLLIKTSFELAESKGYYEYYYSVSSRISNVYERQIQKNKFIPVGRYDYIELEIIPANTQPSVDLYWKLMGQEIKPDSVVIKKRTLRPQFRKV